MANKNNDVCVGELGVTSCCLRWVVVDVKCEVCVLKRMAVLLDTLHSIRTRLLVLDSLESSMGLYSERPRTKA